MKLTSFLLETVVITIASTIAPNFKHHRNTRSFAWSSQNKLSQQFAASCFQQSLHCVVPVLWMCRIQKKKVLLMMMMMMMIEMTTTTTTTTTSTTMMIKSKKGKKGITPQQKFLLFLK